MTRRENGAGSFSGGTSLGLTGLRSKIPTGDCQKKASPPQHTTRPVPSNDQPSIPSCAKTGSLSLNRSIPAKIPFRSVPIRDEDLPHTPSGMSKHNQNSTENKSLFRTETDILSGNVIEKNGNGSAARTALSAAGENSKTEISKGYSKEGQSFIARRGMER